MIATRPNVAIFFALFGAFYCIIAIAGHSQLALYFLPKLANNLIIWPTLCLQSLTLSAWVEVWSTAAFVFASGEDAAQSDR